MLLLTLLKTDAPLPPAVDALARWVAPWQSAYSDSKVVATAVVAVHLVALLLGGGFAVAADRATLRALRVRARTPGAATDPHLEERLLAELGAVHRPVLIAMALLFASGVLLTAADLKTYWQSWVFWAKLALVALLLVNGAVLERAEAGLRRAHTAAGAGRSAAPAIGLWGRLRVATWASLVLWTATTVVGVALTNAG